MSSSSPDPLFVLRGLSGPITSLAFATNASSQLRLLSGTATGIVKLWDIETRRALASFEAGDYRGVQLSVMSVALWHHTLFCQLKDGSMELWNVENHDRPLNTLRIVKGAQGFCRASLLKEEDLAQPLVALQAGDDGNEVHVVNVEAATVVAQLPVPEEKSGMCMCVKLFRHPSSKSLQVAAGYENGTIVLWDVGTRRKLSTVKVHNEPVLSFDLTASCESGISASPEAKLNQFQLQPSPQILKTIDLPQAGVADVAYRHDQRIFAAGCWNGKVRVFSSKTNKPLAVLKQHNESIHSVTFSPRTVEFGQLLAVGSKDERVSVWSLYNEEG